MSMRYRTKRVQIKRKPMKNLIRIQIRTDIKKVEMIKNKRVRKKLKNHQKMATAVVMKMKMINQIMLMMIRI